MTPLPLGNLSRGVVQVALIVGSRRSPRIRLVRLEAPAVRYVLLRALLVICLALPFVQPRVALPRRRQPPAAAGGRASTRVCGAANRRAPASTDAVAPCRCRARGRGDRRWRMLRLLWIAAGIWQAAAAAACWRRRGRFARP